MGAEQNDLPLDADVAELKREAQKAVDRLVAARVELADAIANINTVRGSIAGGSSDAVAFIDNYMNPVAANPAPIAPEVAAPPPAVEPPVFTSVETADLTQDTTSGGSAPVVADELNVVEAPPAGEGTDASGGADTSTEE